MSAKPLAVGITTLVMLEVNAKLIAPGVFEDNLQRGFEKPGHAVDLEVAIVVQNIYRRQKAEGTLVDRRVVATTRAVLPSDQPARRLVTAQRVSDNPALLRRKRCVANEDIFHGLRAPKQVVARCKIVQGEIRHIIFRRPLTRGVEQFMLAARGQLSVDEKILAGIPCADQHIAGLALCGPDVVGPCQPRAVADRRVTSPLRLRARHEKCAAGDISASAVRKHIDGVSSRCCMLVTGVASWKRSIAAEEKFARELIAPVILQRDTNQKDRHRIGAHLVGAIWDSDAARLTKESIDDIYRNMHTRAVAAVTLPARRVQALNQLLVTNVAISLRRVWRTHVET